MFYRAVSVVLLLALLPQVTGCTVRRTDRVQVDELEPPVTEEIAGVTTKAAREVEFDRAERSRPRARISNDTIYATVDGQPFSIAMDEISHVWLRRRDPGGSIVASFFLAVGIVAGVGLIAAAIYAATKDSCPFIYSWDGEKFVFDAEPYGGAIARGLERDDYGELEHLRADDGVYRLRITNEVRETQFTNLLELWVVDHAPGARVIADEWGKLYTISDPRTLLSAVDANGRDLASWLSEKDLTLWEPEAIPGSADELRDEIVMSFPKPEGVTQARLLSNVATGLWGSYMISEMLELRGDEVEAWYDQIDTNPAALDSLYRWNAREETYVLKLEVETTDGWEVRGLLPGGGPFIAEDRVVPLNISGTAGDQLRIRIRPPKGYWSLNWFAVDYGSDQSMSVDTLAPVRAVDHSGRDVLAMLLESDDQYYDMPRTGDYGVVEFVAPPERADSDRTVILHSRGYYRLHLAPSRQPDLATLERLIEETGYAATFAAERYARWRAERSAEP